MWNELGERSGTKAQRQNRVLRISTEFNFKDWTNLLCSSVVQVIFTTSHRLLFVVVWAYKLPNNMTFCSAKRFYGLSKHRWFTAKGSRVIRVLNWEVIDFLPNFLRTYLRIPPEVGDHNKRVSEMFPFRQKRFIIIRQKSEISPGTQS